MCGIAGIHRRGDAPVRNLGKLADGLLLGIAHRGSDATGYLAMKDDGTFTTQKEAIACIPFVTTRRYFSADARTVLLHTRFATRGAADDPNNAHPVVAGKAAAIHNGTIYNDRELFASHKMKRTADVDSIVIPALVNKFGWARANEALSKLDGGAATAVVHADFPTEVILARTSSYPMHVLVGKDVILWASERRAIELAWSYAYGGKPKGDWIDLTERTMLRVNGKISAEHLAPLPKRQPSKWVGGPTSPFGNGKRKKGRKAGTRTTPQTAAPNATKAAALPPVQGQLLTVDDHEPFMDTEVQDLMRWGNCSYEEAYEAVYGVMPPEADDDALWFDVDVPFTRAELNRLVDSRDDIDWGL